LLRSAANAPEAPHPHWMSRRYAATRPIRDDDHVEELRSVESALGREQTFRRALAVSDGLTALTAALVAALVWGAPVKWTLLFVPVGAVLIGKIQGLYDHDDLVIAKSTLSEWRDVIQAAAIVSIAIYLIWWASNTTGRDHGVRLFAFLIVAQVVMALPGRSLARRTARRMTESERCLIVGSTACGEDLAKRIKAIPGTDLIGAVSDDEVDCSVAGVHELVDQLNAQRIIVVPHAGWGEPGVLKLIQSCKWLGVRVSIMPTVMNVVGASAAVDALDSIVLLGVPRFGLSRSSQMLKRAFDLVAASILLVLASPVLLAVAIAVGVDSPGPILFRQKRIGRGGTAFTMLKFRSMVVGAERLKAGLQSQNETSGLFKLDNDPRVTKVGKFIRRTYLDELPQLINVIRGEMSLVGPRPLIRSEDALLQGYDRHRTKLPPGMTGPWQLRGPIDAPLTELAKLDYMYASNWSIWSDIDILLGTAARILNRGGR
jgi:exopolysaccharide biosynthesis polyprenyl glycosylphosphotransferase